MKNNEKLGKVLIGVGFVLIGIPLVVAILYALYQSNRMTFRFLRGIFLFERVSLNINMFQSIFRMWFGGIVGYAYSFRWDFLFLFLPNAFIVSGFVILLNQNQKIEIKKCFNLLVIIGLAINLLVLLRFFGLYSLALKSVFGMGGFGSFIIKSFGRSITPIILFVFRFVFYIIPVLPTFIITAGFLKFFKEEETESNEVVSIADKKVSYFDGGLLSYVGWKILGFFITIFTLGICYPWSLCMVYGWKVNHTTIDGKRLKFNGKALSLFGHWILWGFLTIITLGIFGFWRSIFLKKWIVKNTSLVEPNGIEKPLSTDTDNNASYFDGGLASYIGWKILGFIINVFTLGICYPWSLCMVYGWEINHSVIEGKRQKFNGKALSLLGHWILWIFLLVITLGIYGFWLSIALEKWKVKNTTFEETN